MLSRSWLQVVLLSLLSYGQLVVSECDGEFYAVLTSPAIPTSNSGDFDTDVGLLDFPYQQADDNGFTH